jgi:TP901 family phage tail tape measure protein
MAFNINAQIILSAPKNLNSITKQISNQLGKATKINLNVGGSKQIGDISKKLDAINKNFGRLNSNLKSTRTSISALNSSFNTSASSINNVGRAQSKLATQTGRTNTALKQQSSLLGNLTGRFGSVAKQAIAFGLISRPIYDVQRAFSAAVKDAVSFEKEIVKISQVTGNSVNELSGLKDEINRLATSLGTSANQLAETSRIIAQTGRSAAEIQPILAALAKSTLAPTFGNITDTTEGLIAALGQFQLSASQSEAILGSLNQVSKQFAVEAEDLISVVRRTGGVFAQAAGDSKGTIQALQELTAIFTAVRSTTRESADTIAAGLRTIFSRIQRRSTISFLKQFGVDLEDAQGRFIGIFPAFDQLSTKLETLIKQGDALTLSAIAEELGGIRQIGKLLPAIAEFQKARDAFDAAQRGAVAGLEGDVDKGLQTISNRIDRVKQSFSELIRTLFESEGFQGAFKGLLSTTESILQTITSVVKTVEPILPLLTGLGTLKLGQAFGGFLAGGGLGKIGSAASTVTGQATAQAAQQNVQATQQNTSAINQTNQILTRINTQIANLFTAINSSFTQNVNQLSNLIQINNSGFNNLVRTLTSRPATVPVGGFGGRKASGGSIPKFANGGPVYGPSHAAGGVIAELEGGEYVLPRLNRGTEAGNVRRELKRITTVSPFDPRAGASVRGKGLDDKTTLTVLNNTEAAARRAADLDPFAGAFLRPGDIRSTLIGQNNPAEVEKELQKSPKFKSTLKDFPPRSPVGSQVRKIIKTYTSKNKFKLTAGSLTTPASEQLEDQILKGVVGTIKAGSRQLQDELGIKGATNIALALKSANIDQVIGNIFESILSFAGVPFNPSDPDPPNAPVDFPKGLRSKIARKFGLPAAVPTEAKSSFTEGNLSTFNQKVRKFNLDEAKKELDAVFANLGTIKRASGGEIPVRISNGEMVVTDPREVSARKGELQSINKLSTGGFASGTIARGPGTGTSDSIYTTLPQGAFVVNAASTKKYLGLRRGGGVQRFQRGGVSGGALSFSNKSPQTQKNEQQVQQGLSDLSGAAFTATFAIQSFVSSIEDGKVSSGELFNLLLLLAPTVVQLAGNFKGISAGLQKFKSDLLRAAPKTGPGGIPVLEPAGTAAARRQARGRFAKGAGVGLGLAATFAGDQIGGVAGGTLSGAGSGAAIGSLLGPQGAAIGALVGGATGFAGAQQKEIEDKASKLLAAALTDVDQSTKNLEKALGNNTATLEDFSKSILAFQDLERGIREQRESGSTTRGVGLGSLALDFEEFIGDITTGTTFRQRTTSKEVAVADEQIKRTSDAIQKAAASSKIFLGQVAQFSDLEIGASVNTVADFSTALAQSNATTEQYTASLDALGNVIRGEALDGLKQLERQFDKGLINETELGAAKDLIAQILKDPFSEDSFAAFDAFQVKAEQLGIDLDFVGNAIDSIRADVLAGQLKETTKEINAFGIALGQLNKDVSSALNNFSNEFERIQTLASGGFASSTTVNPFENVSSATPQELQSGFDTLANEFGVQVTPLQKALVSFTNRQPEILKQAAQNIAGGEGAVEGIRNAFSQVTGQGSDALFSSSAFRAIEENLTNLSRGNDAATVLKKFEEQLASGDFEGLSSEVENIVSGFSQLIESTNALRKQFDANVDFEISLQRKELAARLKNAQRIQSFDPFGQRNVFDDLDARVREASLSGGLLAGGGAAGFGESDPAALLARRENLREREATLSADPARDEAANAELREVRKELASNTDALTLLKDDTSRLAKINQDLAAIQARRLQRRQELSRLSTDQGAQQDFFQNQFQALNNILSGRGITTQQAAGIAGLSVDDLAERIQAQNPSVSDEDALKQAKGIQANIAREQATSILRQRGIDEGSAEGQAFIRQFQVAFAKQGETAKEVNLTAQGNTIIESQNEIELKLATENTEKALEDLNASFKTLQDQIDAAVLRFQNLNNNIPQNNNQQGGQGNQGNQGGVASSAPAIPDQIALTSTNDVNVNVFGVDTANEAFKQEVFNAISDKFEDLGSDSNGRPADPSLQNV